MNNARVNKPLEEQDVSITHSSIDERPFFLLRTKGGTHKKYIYSDDLYMGWHPTSEDAATKLVIYLQGSAFKLSQDDKNFIKTYDDHIVHKITTIGWDETITLESIINDIKSEVKPMEKERAKEWEQCGTSVLLGDGKKPFFTELPPILLGKKAWETPNKQKELASILGESVYMKDLYAQRIPENRAWQSVIKPSMIVAKNAKNAQEALKKIEAETEKCEATATKQRGCGL